MLHVVFWQRKITISKLSLHWLALQTNAVLYINQTRVPWLSRRRLSPTVLFQCHTDSTKLRGMWHIDLQTCCGISYLWNNTPNISQHFPTFSLLILLKMGRTQGSTVLPSLRCASSPWSVASFWFFQAGCEVMKSYMDPPSLICIYIKQICRDLPEKSLPTFSLTRLDGKIEKHSSHSVWSRASELKEHQWHPSELPAYSECSSRIDPRHE